MVNLLTQIQICVNYSTLFVLIKIIVSNTMKNFLQHTLTLAILTCASVQGHAELTYSTGQAKISWGDKASLDKAKAIMYNNSNVDTNTPTQANHYTTTTVLQNTYPQNNNNSYNNYNGYNNQTYPTGYYANSKGALVIDALTGQVIYEKNADIARSIASISKVMTALIVAESGANMNEMITLVSSDFQGAKNSPSRRLKVGDQLNRAEMLLMMLMKSENPVAKALARTDPDGYSGFIAKMNKKARELGMQKTVFYDASGLDPRNVSSPRDLAILGRLAYKHNLISQFSTTPYREFFINNISSGFRQVSIDTTNYMVNKGLYNIGFSKTGFIKEAGRCIMFETSVNGRPSIVVLLGAEDTNVRNQDAENIIANLSMRRFS